MDEVGRANRAKIVRDVPVAQQWAVPAAIAGHCDVPVGNVDARDEAVLQHDAAYAPLTVQGIGDGRGEHAAKLPSRGDTEVIRYVVSTKQIALSKIESNVLNISIFLRYI